MKPFIRVTGCAAPLDLCDVDTDQIIPKQFLSRVERTGYGDFLFNDWRRTPDGALDPGFLLNRALYDRATILLAGRNFGCGSSREHAAWALTDFGIRAVIAPSFADIFRNNSDQNGLVCVELAEASLKELMAGVEANPGTEITVDLEGLYVGVEGGPQIVFQMDDFRRERLLHGWDLIDLTLRHEQAIQAYEERLMSPHREGGRAG
jgi:3-isopropylmalate/(R)-2-methylmalate dehydratase small subunit